MEQEDKDVLAAVVVTFIVTAFFTGLFASLIASEMGKSTAYDNVFEQCTSKQTFERRVGDTVTHRLEHCKASYWDSKPVRNVDE